MEAAFEGCEVRVAIAFWFYTGMYIKRHRTWLLESLIGRGRKPEDNTVDYNNNDKG
mgnify:CR=1 FL=1